MVQAVVLAFCVALLGCIPEFVSRLWRLGAMRALKWILPLSFLFYLSTPTLAYPLLGFPGFCVLVMWILGGTGIKKELVDFEPEYWVSWSRESCLFIGVGLLAYLVSMVAGSGFFRAAEYSALLGQPEKRVWLKDVQPKDPRHVRLVPYENADYRADTQLGKVDGAIGSQFYVSDSYTTLQKVAGELVYVSPLDFLSLGSWTATSGAPGYVMVNAEDPIRPVTVFTGHNLVCTPGAYFNDNLERRLWSEGYLFSGLTNYSLEVDDTKKPWWVVTVYHPSIMWWGNVVDGVVVVDPETCLHTFYPLGKIPEWIDRVVPYRFVQEWVNYRGMYSEGWLNSWWQKHNLTQADDDTSIIYGESGHPMLVTGVTSTGTDESLVSLIYTHSSTGESTEYEVVGNTEDVVLSAVNNEVGYRRWHGAAPVLYNIGGVMTDVVPLLGIDHTFQGVAFVRVDNLQVAYGKSVHEAYRAYQKVLSGAGQQEALGTEAVRESVLGQVLRIAFDVQDGDTVYYIQVSGFNHLFTGGSELSPKLPVTLIGDTVAIKYIASGEDVVPMLSFDNTAIELVSSPAQEEIRSRVSNSR